MHELFHYVSIKSSDLKARQKYNRMKREGQKKERKKERKKKKEKGNKVIEMERKSEKYRKTNLSEIHKILTWLRQ